MAEIINNSSDYNDFNNHNDNSFEKLKVNTAKGHLLKEVKEAVKFAGNYHDYELSLDTTDKDKHLIGVQPVNGNYFDITVEDVSAKKFKLVVNLKEGEILEGVGASIGKHTIEFNDLDFTTLGRILNNRVIVELLV